MKNGSKAVTLTPSAGAYYITPYYMATMSDQMFLAGEGIDASVKPNIGRYYCYGVSIELAFKAAILSSTSPTPNLAKEIGHDLEKAFNRFKDNFSTTFLTEQDIEVTNKLNPFFKRKKLEYCGGEMAYAILTGYKDLPSIEDTQRTSKKLNDWIKSQNLFFESGFAKTTE